MRANKYKGRYPVLKYRRAIWKEIVDYVLTDTGPIHTLVELGPGFCDFINQFPAQVKIGFDLNSEMCEFAEKSIHFNVADANCISKLKAESVDMVLLVIF